MIDPIATPFVALHTTESTMHDYRVVMLSTDPESDVQFVIYPRAATEREAVDVANQQYGPHFEVDRSAVTDIML